MISKLSKSRDLERSAHGLLGEYGGPRGEHGEMCGGLRGGLRGGHSGLRGKQGGLRGEHGGLRGEHGGLRGEHGGPAARRARWAGCAASTADGAVGGAAIVVAIS